MLIRNVQVAHKFFDHSFLYNDVNATRAVIGRCL